MVSHGASALDDGIRDTSIGDGPVKFSEAPFPHLSHSVGRLGSKQVLLLRGARFVLAALAWPAETLWQQSWLW